MAYKLVSSASNSYTTAATLGNILTKDSISVEVDQLTWPNFGSGYIFSQAPSSSSNREFGVFFNGGSLQLTFGGNSSGLMSNSELSAAFGSSITEVDVAFEFDIINSTYEIFADGSSIKTGSFGDSGNRTDGVLFRFGARSNVDSSGDTSGGFIGPSGYKLGNSRVYIDGALVRNYVSDGTGSTWEETVDSGSSDATLRNFSGTTNSWWVFYDDGGGVSIPVIMNHLRNQGIA
jgi:hypothetical protein